MPIILPLFFADVSIAVSAKTFTIMSEAAAEDKIRPTTIIAK